MGQMRIDYNLVGKPKQRRRLGRPWSKCTDNTIKNFKEIVNGMDWNFIA
jgi:hypothetical protein